MSFALYFCVLFYADNDGYIELSLVANALAVNYADALYDDD